MNYNFEWDPKKAKSNFKKHGIAFESAAMVFKDQQAISIYDENHSEAEERWLTMGIDSITRVLVVVHTYRYFEGNECVIRIISARKAITIETSVYKGEQS